MSGEAGKGDDTRVSDWEAYYNCPLWENLKKAKHDVCQAVTDENAIKMLDLPVVPEDKTAQYFIDEMTKRVYSNGKVRS